MKVEKINNTPAKKLVAVIGEQGSGIFFRSNWDDNASFFVSHNTGLVFQENNSLEDVLKHGKFRVGVYEGDEIKLTF